MKALARGEQLGWSPTSTGGGLVPSFGGCITHPRLFHWSEGSGSTAFSVGPRAQHCETGRYVPTWKPPSISQHSRQFKTTATATGLVEPMRTENDHQRRGLGRHVLTAGINLLFDAGADRIKIAWERDNLAASTLYAGAGFKLARECAVVSRAGKNAN